MIQDRRVNDPSIRVNSPRGLVVLVGCLAHDLAVVGWLGKHSLRSAGDLSSAGPPGLFKCLPQTELQSRLIGSVALCKDTCKSTAQANRHRLLCLRLSTLSIVGHGFNKTHLTSHDILPHTS